MKAMTTWSLKPGALKETVNRFLATGAPPAEGVTLIGRWHSTDFSCGFSLFESDDAAALYRSAARWADLIDMKTILVVEDSDAGPALAAVFKS